jgi:hypothetical protein
MEPTISQDPKTTAKDFFLNLGSIIALYTTIIALLDLLFTIISKAYPQISTYNYYSSASISFPVATLIIFSPIYILLMWLMQREYKTIPEKHNLGVKKWLTYITLFIAGLTAAIDLVIVLYYFLNGNEITLGFILKVLVVLIVAKLVFWYYIEDIRNKLTSHKQKSWLALAVILIIASIVWGFAVLGSPRTQQLLKYDEQKVNDLQTINSDVISFYQDKGYIPGSLAELASSTDYYTIPLDEQTGQPYGYILVGQSAKAYQLCATFNKASSADTLNNAYNEPMIPVGASVSWNHPAGYYCFSESIPVSQYVKVPGV